MLYIKRFGGKVFINSNIELFVKFTNEALSLKFVLNVSTFFNYVKELQLSHKSTKRQIKAWDTFFASMIRSLPVYTV